MNRAAALAWLCLAACSSRPDTAPPPAPAVRASRSKWSDGPGDAERRAKFLAGASAQPAKELVATNNPAHLDAVASFFIDPQKPYGERLGALAALRTLRDQDPGEYARLFPRVRPKLWEEVSHSVGLAMSPENEKAFIEAIGWLADQKDPQARLTLELHLDRETVKRKRLPEPALAAAALGLASYPESESARETLWSALKDPKEVVSVRACCLKSLKSFHPKDLEAQIVQLAAAPGDDWLRDLQRRLR
ncbi:MAG: hypothetical protein HY293_15870 [Planctomycetes bacterium]|nr:hypothetical protein [Planctomycetota bacterium]